MAITTTCIGSYPKPSYLPLRDWFQEINGLTNQAGVITSNASAYYKAGTTKISAADETLYVKATEEAVRDQRQCGIKIPTDGEQRRENYIHYHCRHLNGFNFHDLTERTLRDGAYHAALPTIVGEIAPKSGHFLDSDYRIAQRFTSQPVKITVPGPITIIDSCADQHYGNNRRLAFDIAAALNVEIHALADAGCRYIQIDEPLFVRNLTDALDFGIACLERCFEGIAESVTRTVHICCGYPNHLDDSAYHKADPSCYFSLAKALDSAAIDQISIEDAHRHNDLTLLEHVRDKTVILGCLAIANSRIEAIDEIAARLTEALEHIDRDRLIAAPDCGLAMLGRERALSKLKALCAAAESV